MTKYNSDDTYLFDLNVRVKENSIPGQYQYMIKLEHSFYINCVLARCYYRYESVIDENDEVCITTNCEPDAFKMVFERALMDKLRDDTGLFALTPNELKDHFLTESILNAARTNGYAEYEPN